MLERLAEVFCEVDDFCQAFFPQWEAHLIGSGAAPRGPEPGLCASEIITLLLVLHGSRFKYLKNFYNGIMGESLRGYFPNRPGYERFVTIQKSGFIPLRCFLFSRMGQKTGVYYIDSAALPVCHNPAHPAAPNLCRSGRTRQDLDGLVLRLQAASGVQSLE